MASRLSDIVEPGPAERLITGYAFTEGPLWDPSGCLYFSDVDEQVQYRLASGGSVEVVRAASGGANGAAFDSRANLVLCEQDARRVVRMDPDGTVVPILESFDGLPLNRCNDIVRKSDGALYFTDPQLKLPLDERIRGHSSIYRIATDGDVAEIATDLNHPNGIAFSPDESVLYVSNTRPDPHLHVYPVEPDGSLGPGSLFADMPYLSGEAGGVPDGLKVDQQGRIFCTGPGGIWVFDSGGTVLGVVELPELPANLAWGDQDFQSLYVCARSSIYRLRARSPGAGTRKPTRID
jgi:gluconolactonase